MKLQFGISLLMIVIVFLIGSCTAITSIATTELVGNLADQIDITSPSNIGNWNFVLGLNTASGTIYVNANNIWGLNVKSDRPDGKMEWWRDGAYGNNLLPYLNQPSLTNPMQVGFNGGDPLSLLGADQPLITNKGPVNQDYPISFKQEIVPGDSRVSPPARYHIVVTFTGFISY